MGEYVVAAPGLEGPIQNLLFAIALENPGTSILLGRAGLVLTDGSMSSAQVGIRESQRMI